MRSTSFSGGGGGLKVIFRNCAVGGKCPLASVWTVNAIGRIYIRTAVGCATLAATA